MNWILRKLNHEDEKKKESFMIKNGGILLENLIKSSGGKYNPYRCFSVREIKKATNNFGRQNLISKGFCKLYHGFLGGRLVSVMKYHSSVRSVFHYYDNTMNRMNYCINNIVFKAQMCHKSALKLIGCCLETETPIAVFESIKCGSLAERLCWDSQSDFEPLLWMARLKIAMEIANAIAYLHLGFSRPIIFRDISSQHVVFNDENVAKLFDFSMCISIPEDKTHVTGSRIAGSYGYHAPEIYNSGHYNEKSDVFSFGVLLLVLVTGQEAVDRNCTVHPRGQVLKHIDSNGLKTIVDPIIVGEGLSHEKEQQLCSFAGLAIRCSEETRQRRPEMVDVAKEIQQLYLSCSSGRC